MHAVYLSLGNISKGERKAISNGAWILLAEIPSNGFGKTKFETKVKTKKMPGLLKHQRFHKCLAKVLEPLHTFQPSADRSCLYPAIDAEGYRRECFPVLMAWIADLEEQWDILGLAKNSCPKCRARHGQLDHACLCETRTGQQILGVLRQIGDKFPDASSFQFMREAKKEGLSGVEELCWEGLTVDMCRAICIDSLHTYHKMFGDHVMAWITHTIGEADLDAHFSAQPHRIGARNFSAGISHLSQLSGKEWRDMERHLAPVIAGHSNASPRVLKSIRGLLDFIFKALFPMHSDHTLAQMMQDHEVFRQNRTIFISNGSRDIDHMKIPKLHYLPHTKSNVEDLGTTDNFSTEPCESLHVTHCKNAYKATNRKAYRTQIIRYLVRQESLLLYSNFLRYCLDATSDARPHPPHALDLDHEEADSWDDVHLDVDTSLRPSESISEHIAHAVRPHRAAVLIDNIIDQLSPIDIVSPLVRYFQYNDNGCGRRTNRSYFARRDLPVRLEVLEVWHSFQLSHVLPNEFYPPWSTTIHCKPAHNNKPAIFDTVLIEVDPSQMGLKRELLSHLLA